jgi:hypothetical protein
MQWRQHTLESLKRCGRYYQLRELEGWTLPEEPAKMTFGSAFHAMLEAYEVLLASGHSEEHALLRALEAARAFALPPVGKYSQEQLLRGFAWYTDWAQQDALRTVVHPLIGPLVEWEFEVSLPNGDTLGGRVDRVVELEGALWILDHKTTETTLAPEYFLRFGTAEQVSAYTYAAGRYLGRPVAGFIIDAIQVYAEGFRFMRGVATRTPAQLAEWLADTLIHIERGEQSRNAGHWPMNSAACSVYGKCLYRDSICAKDPAARPKLLQAHYVQKSA